MKKKTYQQPKMEVVEIEQTDIICTSGTQIQSQGGFDPYSTDDTTFNGGW